MAKKEDKSMFFYAKKYKEILLIRFTYTKWYPKKRKQTNKGEKDTNKKNQQTKEKKNMKKKDKKERKENPSQKIKSFWI